MLRVLVVSPHPDDAELGCGGMIYSRADVTIAVCTGPGDLTMVHSGATIPFCRRMDEQVHAAAMLGAKLRWLNLAPASKFDTVPQSVFVSAFDALFPYYDEVILPLPSYNDDHTKVWNAGMAAFRPGKLDRVSLLAYEQPMQNHGEMPHGSITGKRYVPMSQTALFKKVEALSAHKSQMVGRETTIYGSSGVRTLARLRGLEVGTDFAEMLHVVREVVNYE